MEPAQQQDGLRDDESQQSDLFEAGGGVLRLRVISPDGQILWLEGISVRTTLYVGQLDEIDMCSSWGHDWWLP